MNNNNGNQEQINRIIENLTKKINSDSADSAPSQSDVDSILKGLDQKQSDKIKSILNDPEATRQILSSPQAQAIIKKFGGKKG